MDSHRRHRSTLLHALSSHSSFGPASYMSSITHLLMYYPHPCPLHLYHLPMLSLSLSFCVCPYHPLLPSSVLSPYVALAVLYPMHLSLYLLVRIVSVFSLRFHSNHRTSSLPPPNRRPSRKENTPFQGNFPNSPFDKLNSGEAGDEMGAPDR